MRWACWAAVAGQVPIGTLPRSWVLIEHIAFSFLRTAWRCARAASCKRYATRGLSQRALRLPRSPGAAHDAIQTERPATRRPTAAGGVRDLTQRVLSPAPRVAGEVDGIARKAG